MEVCVGFRTSFNNGNFEQDREIFIRNLATSCIEIFRLVKYEEIPGAHPFFDEGRQSKTRVPKYWCNIIAFLPVFKTSRLAESAVKSSSVVGVCG